MESDGEKYLDIHRQLMSYFVRKGCLTPDDLADATLTRVARRLEEEGAITDILPGRRIQSSSHTRSPSFRDRSATLRTTTLSLELWLKKTSKEN